VEEKGKKEPSLLFSATTGKSEKGKSEPEKPRSKKRPVKRRTALERKTKEARNAKRNVKELRQLGSWGNRKCADVQGESGRGKRSPYAHGEKRRTPDRSHLAVRHQDESWTEKNWKRRGRSLIVAEKGGGRSKQGGAISPNETETARLENQNLPRLKESTLKRFSLKDPWGNNPCS